MNDMIRLATPSDSEELLRIYAPCVRDTAISFETEAPAVDEFSRRIEAIGKQYPYLVYAIGGAIAGYAYASRHRERDAYRFGVDVSIYVLPEHHGSGAARKLYACLLAILQELGYYNAYAGYTAPNERSRRFHEKFGFATIGTHHRTGYKLGKWHDVVWMEKALRKHDEQPGTIKSIAELPEEWLNALFLSCATLLPDRNH